MIFGSKPRPESLLAQAEAPVGLLAQAQDPAGAGVPASEPSADHGERPRRGLARWLRRQSVPDDAEAGISPIEQRLPQLDLRLPHVDFRLPHVEVRLPRVDVRRLTHLGLGLPELPRSASAASGARPADRRATAALGAIPGGIADRLRSAVRIPGPGPRGEQLVDAHRAGRLLGRRSGRVVPALCKRSGERVPGSCGLRSRARRQLRFGTGRRGEPRSPGGPAAVRAGGGHGLHERRRPDPTTPPRSPQAAPRLRSAPWLSAATCSANSRPGPRSSSATSS